MSLKKKIWCAIGGIVVGCLLYLLVNLGSFNKTPETPTEETPPLSLSLKPELLEQARRATVFIQGTGVSHVDDSKISEGSGTGFFISADGRIATNWHVVSFNSDISGIPIALKTKDLKVIIHSGMKQQEALPARIIAADPRSDLAILKVQREGCDFLKINDTDAIGETTPVSILGFPFGNLFTVLQRGPEISINRGFITSLRHDDRGTLERIQFDAAVNRGNSGGPLVLPDGQVCGIANIALGTSRVNFAVPAAKILSLLEQCPLDSKIGEKCSFSVESEPKATVYLGSNPLGSTPIQSTCRGGYHRLVFTAPGYRTVTKWVSIHDGKTITTKMRPLENVSLKTRPLKKVIGVSSTPMECGDEMFTEDFAAGNTTDAWEQDTGGDDKTRTWYVQDGQLHQFNPDGLLHAIFFGDKSWKDYSFSAKVKIGTNENDGRAGLIFRHNENGFALFRLFRETNKVQLAWHSKSPFGWRFLAEEKLDFDVKGDQWYRMEVQARGDHIMCLLDDRIVMETKAESIIQGDVGFYSVDSTASFDDVVIRKIKGSSGRKAAKLGQFRFWFSDHFQEDYGCWRSTCDFESAAPWATLHSGCLQTDESKGVRINILDKYDVHDCRMQCLVSCGAGSTGVVLRHDGSRCYAIAIRPSEEKISLLLLEMGKPPKQLAEGKIAERAPVKGLYHLMIVSQGEKISVHVNGAAALQATDATLKNGRIGLYTESSRALFHTISFMSLDQ